MHLFSNCEGLPSGSLGASVSGAVLAACKVDREEYLSWLLEGDVDKCTIGALQAAYEGAVDVEEPRKRQRCSSVGGGLEREIDFFGGVVLLTAEIMQAHADARHARRFLYLIGLPAATRCGRHYRIFDCHHQTLPLSKGSHGLHDVTQKSCNLFELSQGCNS